MDSFFSILFIWALVRFKFPTSQLGPWRQKYFYNYKMTNISKINKESFIRKKIISKYIHYGSKNKLTDNKLLLIIFCDISIEKMEKSFNLKVSVRINEKCR